MLNDMPLLYIIETFEKYSTSFKFKEGERGVFCKGLYLFIQHIAFVRDRFCFSALGGSNAKIFPEEH